MATESAKKFILGTKGRMTQVFDENGVVTPATVIAAGPMTAVQVKTAEKDGYSAVQFGFGTRREKNVAKAQRGHTKDIGTFRTFKEQRLSAQTPDAEVQRGDTVDVSLFQPGDTVSVAAVSKGKGFQGVVKRHNFAGGPRTHGQKHSERAPGSIGAQGPQRVLKGKRMAGRMGGNRVTVKNLTVLQVDPDTNTLVISGAVPGRPGTTVEIHG